MAGFDKSLDKELFKKEISLDNTKVVVGVYSYNENAPKLQLSRLNYNEERDDYSFAKLGRLTKEEVEQMIPAIEEAIKNM